MLVGSMFKSITFSQEGIQFILISHITNIINCKLTNNGPKSFILTLHIIIRFALPHSISPVPEFSLKLEQNENITCLVIIVIIASCLPLQHIIDIKTCFFYTLCELLMVNIKYTESVK